MKGGTSVLEMNLPVAALSSWDMLACESAQRTLSCPRLRTAAEDCNCDATRGRMERAQLLLITARLGAQRCMREASIASRQLPNGKSDFLFQTETQPAYEIHRSAPDGAGGAAGDGMLVCSCNRHMGTCSTKISVGAHAPMHSGPEPDVHACLPCTALQGMANSRLDAAGRVLLSQESHDGGTSTLGARGGRTADGLWTQGRRRRR